MKRNSSLWVVTRALLIVGSAGTIAGAATFASLQSQQAVLASNTISSATASLLVSTDNINFNNSKPGFNFANVVPGGAAVPTAGNPAYLKNSGTANLGLKIAISSVPSNLNNVDLNKVYLRLTRYDGSFDRAYPVKSLIDSYAAGGIATGDLINAGSNTQYLLRVSMDADAFNGTTGITISGIDLVFTGLAQ